MPKAIIPKPAKESFRNLGEMQNLKEYLDTAHKHSIYHKNELLQSDICGCFYCLRIFDPEEITDWTDTHNLKEHTALCPFCGIDSVIGEKSGFPVSDKIFLNTMHTYFFKFSPDSE